MNKLFRYARTVTLSAAMLLSYATLAAVDAPHAGAVTPVSAFYLDIGASASLGVQPVAGYPKGQRTDKGYADDVVALEAAKGVTLDLYKIGCSGETTSSMLFGGDHCYVPPDTQISEALTFLKTHRSENGLVTIDLGFNDLRTCLHNWTSDQTCVNRQLDIVRQQLTQIVGQLKDAAGPNVKFIGVGHYDPFLADLLNSPSDAMVPDRSLRIMRHLDAVLSGVYGSFSIPMADVGRAFKINSVTPVAVAGWGTLRANVADVCLLTWMCEPAPMGPNIHPNDAGYAVIAGAIVDELTPW